MHSIYVGISMERGQKFTFFKWYSVYLISWGRNAKVSVDRIVLEISRIMRDSSFVMCSILCMEIDWSVVLGHNYLAIVIGENFEFDDFTIDASQTF